MKGREEGCGFIEGVKGKGNEKKRLLSSACKIESLKLRIDIGFACLHHTLKNKVLH